MIPLFSLLGGRGFYALTFSEENFYMTTAYNAQRREDFFLNAQTYLSIGQKEGVTVQDLLLGKAELLSLAHGHSWACHYTKFDMAGWSDKMSTTTSERLQREMVADMRKSIISLLGGEEQGQAILVDSVEDDARSWHYCFTSAAQESPALIVDFNYYDNMVTVYGVRGMVDRLGPVLHAMLAGVEAKWAALSHTEA